LLSAESGGTQRSSDQKKRAFERGPEALGSWRQTSVKNSRAFLPPDKATVASPGALSNQSNHAFAAAAASSAPSLNVLKSYVNDMVKRSEHQCLATHSSHSIAPQKNNIALCKPGHGLVTKLSGATS
jgi:hypothetical protein